MEPTVINSDALLISVGDRLKMLQVEHERLGAEIEKLTTARRQVRLEIDRVANGLALLAQPVDAHETVPDEILDGVRKADASGEEPSGKRTPAAGTLRPPPVKKQRKRKNDKGQRLVEILRADPKRPRPQIAADIYGQNTPKNRRKVRALLWHLKNSDRLPQAVRHAIVDDEEDGGGAHTPGAMAAEGDTE
jgi:hypothetical protein